MKFIIPLYILASTFFNSNADARGEIPSAKFLKKFRPEIAALVQNYGLNTLKAIRSARVFLSINMQTKDEIYILEMTGDSGPEYFYIFDRESARKTYTNESRVGEPSFRRRNNPVFSVEEWDPRFSQNFGGSYDGKNPYGTWDDLSEFQRADYLLHDGKIGSSGGMYSGSISPVKIDGMNSEEKNTAKNLAMKLKEQFGTAIAADPERQREIQLISGLAKFMDFQLKSGIRKMFGENDIQQFFCSNSFGKK